MRLLLSVLLVAACSCASATRRSAPEDVGAPAREAPTLDALWHDVSIVMRERTAAAYRRWVGENDPKATTPRPGSPLDPATLARLRGPETLETVRAAAAAATGERARDLGQLYALLLSERVREQTAIVDLELERLGRTRITLASDGANPPLEATYEEIPILLAQIADPAERHALGKARVATAAQLLAKAEERDRLWRAAARPLGYIDLASLATALRRADVRPVATEAKRLLIASQALFTSALDELGPAELGLPLADWTLADFPRLKERPRLAGTLPASELLATTSRTFSAMGINLSQLPIRIDTEVRPGKQAHAACFAVGGATDIRISVKPRSAPADYEALLHELGHAVPLALGAPSSFDPRLLGSGATAEAFAFVIESLAGNPDWLGAAGLGEADRLASARLFALERLTLARRYAAMLVAGLHSDGVTGAAHVALYREALAQALGIHVDDDDATVFAAEAEPVWVAADELDGWMLAGMLEDRLLATYGDGWWRSPDAVASLRQLWPASLRADAASVAKELGGELSIVPMLRNIARRLAVTGATTGSTPALSNAEAPALSNAEAPALSNAEAPALRHAEAPAPSNAARPAASSAEGH